MVNYQLVRVVVPRAALCAWAFAFMLPIGCSRPKEWTYVVADEVKALSPTHQRQIAERLRLYFGTPVDPRLRIPAPETEDSEDTGKPTAEDEPEGTAEHLVDVVEPAQLRKGAAVFRQRCAGCHGLSGDGNGEAAPYLQPRPRDYRLGIFKFMSTPIGQKPTRGDLANIIRHGAKGTSMPAFRFLPDDELDAVIDYVIMLSHRGELELTMARIADSGDYEPEELIDPIEFNDSLTLIHQLWENADAQVVYPLTPQPRMTNETILAGRKAFLQQACSKCHGPDFRGQTAWLSREFLAAQEAKPEGAREQINYDKWGHPAPAADLTAGMLHGGRRPIDIYRRIYSGINGTPMPAFGPIFASEPDTIWYLVHYVLSVVEDRDVPGLDEVVADPSPATGSP